MTCAACAFFASSACSAIPTMLTDIKALHAPVVFLQYHGISGVLIIMSDSVFFGFCSET